MVENMSEKKSPPRKEKPSSSKTPQSAKGENKTLKRKLFPPGANSEDEEKKTTPKRRRSLLAGESSPPAMPGTPKTPGGVSRLTVPLSERQQMALLMQMTAEEESQQQQQQQMQQQQQQGQQPPSQAQVSPRPSSPHSAGKKTPLDKKINKRNERGETPLHVAAIRGDEKLTKRLLKAGADVNVKDYAGWTPLHEACNHGWLVVAKQLMKAGANVNVQGLENDTPLHDAAINGHAKLVEVLVRHGANPLQTNARGKSPLDVAANENIGRLLRNEIIASSSNSSSTDEVRSPTSPESNVSDKEDDKKDKEFSDSVSPSSLISSPRSSGFLSGHLAGGSSGSGLLSGGPLGKTDNHLSSPPHGNPATQNSTSSAPSIFRKVHVTHHMDKSSSPRLTLKFQHIKTNANKRGSTLHRDKSSSNAKYKTYSVSLGTNNDYEHIDRPLSPGDSSSSNDSDLYDPQLEITTYGSKRGSGLSSLVPSHGQGGEGHREPHRDLLGHPRDVSRDHQRERWDSSVSRNSHNNSRDPMRDSFSHNRGHEPHQDVHGSSGSRDGKHGSLDSHDPSRGDTGMNRLDRVTSHSESHSTAKVKQEHSLQGSSIGVVPDSQMPTLSQESGPFAPHFEDISDAEDSSEPMEVDMKPSSSLTSHSPHIPVSSQPVPISGRQQPTSRADVSSSSDTKQTGASLGSGGSGTSVVASNNAYSPKPSSSGGSTSHGQIGGADPAPSSGLKTERESLLPSKHRHLRESQAALSVQTVAKHIKIENEEAERPKICDQSDFKQLSIKTEMPSPKSDKFPTRTTGDKDMNSVPSNISRSMCIPEKDNVVVKTETKETKNDVAAIGVKTEKEKSSIKPERESSRSPKLGDREEKVSPTVDQKSPKNVKDPSKAPPPPKLDMNRASPKPSDRECRDSKDSRDSPKSDKGSRPPTPKVPPLKIIIPPKSSSTVDKETHNLKTLLTKPALPYVLNPTQEGEGAVAAGTGNPEVNATSQASSRASSTISEMDTEKGEDNVTSTQTEMNLRITRQRTQEKAEAAPEADKEREEKIGVDKDDKKEDSKEGENKEAEKKEESVERRVTRSAFRSQQQQKQEKEPAQQTSNGKDDTSSQNNDKENQKSVKDEVVYDIHPRKRKLRQRQAEQNSNDSHSLSSSQSAERPTNPFELFLDIRRKVANRHNQWLVVTPKAPQGFKDYLMVSCNYVLEGKTRSRLSVPTLTPPNSLTGPMRDLFEAQEKERYKLRLQHVIEREKLMLSMEQETLRVHGRAARAMVNQQTPLSVCTILRDEEIYNTIESDNDKDKNVRSRYNGRQLLSWLQDVEDKFEKTKRALLLRHHHEADSLAAVQKLEWEWRLKEAGACDHRTNPSIDDLHVPMIQVSDEFDLLPS